MPTTITRYAVVYESASAGWGAYVPDLPGCVAAAANQKECETLIREAIEIHLDAMRRDGDPIPEPLTEVGYVALA